MPGIFLGLKFQACVFFGVCNMNLRRTPPSCILRVPPWDIRVLTSHFMQSSIFNSVLRTEKQNLDAKLAVAWISIFLVWYLCLYGYFQSDQRCNDYL